MDHLALDRASSLPTLRDPGPPWETADPILSAKEAKDRLREIYAPLSQAGPGNDINTGSTLAAVRGFTKSHEPL